MEFTVGIVISIWYIFMQFFLLCKFSYSASSPSSSFVRNEQVDKISLHAIKADINDTRGSLSSWNESLPFCLWRGVTCGRKHQRVTDLDLRSCQLKGRLSPHIGNLTFLRKLHLQNNSFRGTIPQQIGHLFRLRHLYLHNNSFTGNFPFNISHCSNLQYLSLFKNTISGRLPIEIGSLSKLQLLDLGRNNFVGEIPTSFGNLSSLKALSLQKNHLHGGIPNSLGQLKALKFLSVATNNFNGILPPSIYNLSSINLISVSLNKLHGTLPPGLGHTIFPNLETFNFLTNQFSGPLPVSISNASSLSDFQISENKFTGKVPSLARVISLYWLSLDENNLGNNEEDDLDFLSSLTNCTSLEILDIDTNNFGGVLPESISNLSTQLSYITFGRNQIRGSIPIGISNLINLEGLGIEENLLTGSIPSSMGKLNQLQDLSLNENQLLGTIPSSLGNLTSLGMLFLSSNKLQGSIPESLGECTNLLSLVLSQNNLSGTIPKQVMNLSSLSQELGLSSNQLTGSIPIEVGNLLNLVSLDVSENKLSGGIPQSLGRCTSLTSLHLEGNSLQGTIPESLSSMRGIEVFDLSHNNFYGRIPIYFENFHFLQILNLSFNDFEGTVPIEGVFKNKSALSIMGNTRLCGGMPHLRLPICSKPSKQRFSSRLKMIIPITCGVIALILALLLILLCWSRKGRVLESTLESSFGVSLLKVSYGDLLKATNGFSAANLIGVGSFGSVYKGIILNKQEERIVAVKVLNLQSSRASKSFIAECEALRSIRHRNLVKLLTACSSIDFHGQNFKALVYEYMENGCVDEWLHISAPRAAGAHIVQWLLELIQRVNIAIDVASALDYLHNHYDVPIVHCDLKPSNILLDANMTAYVGDFGLARFLPDALCPLPSPESASSAIRGSIGYTAPEYGLGSEVSTYGDVYSYGILLLEMLTGKKPTDEMFKDGLNLRNYVQMALPGRVEEICEPAFLRSQESCAGNNNSTYKRHDVCGQSDERRRVEECLISIAKVGVTCSAEMPRARMDMSNVVAELCLARDVLTGTRTPREHNRIMA